VSKRAVTEARPVSDLSQGLSRPKNEENILITSPSIQRLLSDDNDLEAPREGTGLEEGLEEAGEIRENREDSKSAEIK
jgi:hypothetical protein